jgi:hypothetical protein
MLGVGETYYGEISITNHGLIDAYNPVLEYESEVMGFEIEVFVDALPEKIAAQKTYTIPYKITRVKAIDDQQLASICDDLTGYGGGMCTIPVGVALKAEYQICHNTPNERSITCGTGIIIYIEIDCDKQNDPTEIRAMIVQQYPNIDIEKFDIWDPNQFERFIPRNDCGEYGNGCSASIIASLFSPNLDQNNPTGGNTSSFFVPCQYHDACYGSCHNV